MTVADNISLLVPIANQDGLDAKVIYTGPIEAPIVAGQALGELVISLGGLPEHRVPLVAEHDVPLGGFNARIRIAGEVLWDKFGLSPDIIGAES
ncbi:MAG: D-alanyl-D-alanine carboxypeptidase (penicillin-binding protein 5/6) [bacterium]